MKNKKIYKKDRRGTIISLLIFSFVLMLSVGYTALNESLTISGEANFRVEEDIRITDIRLLSTSNGGIEDFRSSFGKDSTKVGVTLPNNNSTVTYKVAITNYSNIPMKLTSIEKSVANNNYNISFNKTLPLTIAKLSEEEIEITFSNNTNTEQTINANILFTFEKLESIMATGSNGAATTTFYNGPITKDSVESITFMSTKEVPNDAIGYWDASYTAGSNEVVAYYLDEDEDNLYELYIAADGEVYSPANSGYLFQNFTNLTAINFNNLFNTEKSTSMERMFFGCSSLVNLNVSNFDTSKVTNMSQMFYECSNLLSLDLSNFETPNLTTVTSWYNTTYYGMFYKCSALTSLNVSNFDTSKVTNMGGLFRECSSLTSLNLSNFDTSKVTIMEGMFTRCSALTNLNISSFNTLKVRSFCDGWGGNGMFQFCSSLTSLNLSNFYTPSISGLNMRNMFQGCSSLTSLDISNFDTSNVTSMDGLFNGCKALTSLDLSNFDTSKVTAFGASSYYPGMFAGCSSLTSLDLSNFNTSSATDMRNMFAGCSSLTSLNLSNFYTPNVTNMGQMFKGCSALTSLNISNFDTSKVTNMASMFDGCSSLTSLNLSSFNTQNVTSMQSMFLNCSSLTSLDLSSFDTSNVTYFLGFQLTFANCTSLNSLDISNFTVNDSWTDSMFNNVKNGATVYVKDASVQTKVQGYNSRLNVVIKDA